MAIGQLCAPYPACIWPNAIKLIGSLSPSLPLSLSLRIAPDRYRRPMEWPASPLNRTATPKIQEQCSVLYLPPEKKRDAFTDAQLSANSALIFMFYIFCIISRRPTVGGSSDGALHFACASLLCEPCASLKALFE